MHYREKLKKKENILFNLSPPFQLKYSFFFLSLCLLFLFVLDSRVSTSLFLLYLFAIFSLFFSHDQRLGRWVSWMAWVSGSAMAWSVMVGLEHKINSGSAMAWSVMTMAMASLLSLDQAQMVGLMVVWVCVVVGGWLFFGSGKVDCAVCVVVLWQWLWIVPFVVFFW